MKAFVWKSGQINIAEIVPDGAIEIAIGPDEVLRTSIINTCRIAYDSQTCLVPGIPEAINSDAALDALFTYKKHLNTDLSRRLAELAGAPA